MQAKRLVPALTAALLAATALPALAWDRHEAVTFATLPAGTAHPEGITADAEGNLYVADFDVNRSAGPGELLVFGPDGSLLRQFALQNSSHLLLGLAFRPGTGDLLVIDFGGHQVLRVDPASGASTVFTTIPGGTAAGPNALAFDADGNVYISDSFQGTIWRTGPDGGTATAWVTDDLLKTTGVPPFGANGLGFNKAGTSLFVANTGNDTVVRIPVAAGVAGKPEVFVNSINGADGLQVDANDNLWVAANQADEIVVVDPTGRVIAKLGDFGGIDENGSPIGLLFPASTVQVGNFIYVTNLSLDLRGLGITQAVDSQWAGAVTRHTIARLPARIPPAQGLCPNGAAAGCEP